MAVSLENHLAACTQCDGDVASLRQAWASLDAMPRVELPPYFHENLMSRLAAGEDATAQQRARWDWRTLFRPRSLGMAAAGLIIALTGLGVAHTERAALDPLGFLLGRSGAQAESTVGLKSSSHAEWVSTAQGGRLVLHLQAQPSSDGAVTRLRFSLNASDPGALHQSSASVVTSEQETSFETPMSAPPTGKSVSLFVTAADSNARGDWKVVRIPLTTAGSGSP